MSKITVRIPTEQYAYIECEYDSKEDYEKNYPDDAVAIYQTRQNAQNAVAKLKEDEAPFVGNEYAKGRTKS